MKAKELYNYLGHTHPNLTWRDKIIIINEVRKSSKVVKSKIEEAVRGEVDLTFALTAKIDDIEYSVSLEDLVEKCQMHPIQAFLFIDWFLEEPYQAVDFLKTRDVIHIDFPNNDSSVDESILDSDI